MMSELRPNGAKYRAKEFKLLFISESVFSSFINIEMASSICPRFPYNSKFIQTSPSWLEERTVIKLVKSSGLPIILS
jgi:hypothetical protein